MSELHRLNAHSIKSYSAPLFSWTMVRPSIQANFSAVLSDGGCISDAKAGEVFYESSVTHFPLLSHTEDGCSICEMITKHSVGGRSRKERKNRGRPGENSMHTLCQHIYRLHPLVYGL